MEIIIIKNDFGAKDGKGVLLLSSKDYELFADKLRLILNNIQSTNNNKAEQILEKHWKLRTGKELDDMTKQHMSYCIDAINEALTLKEE